LDALMPRRLAPFVLLLLLAGSVGPFAWAGFEKTLCCCPAGVTACPVHETSCSFKNGCGSQTEASPAPPTAFSLPTQAFLLTAMSSKGFKIELAVSTLSWALPVPDPPPRG
jgi:hypothetical protein